MKKLLILFLFISSAAFAQQGEKQLWGNLPVPEGVVNDYEHLYTDEEKARLTEIINEFDKVNGIAIMIVTIDPKLTPKEEFDTLTKQIAESRATNKNHEAITICISAGYHRIRIKNNDRIIKLLSDNETYGIIQNFIVPEFKENKYYTGTLNGLSEIIQALNKKLKK